MPSDHSFKYCPDHQLVPEMRYAASYASQMYHWVETCAKYIYILHEKDCGYQDSNEFFLLPWSFKTSCYCVSGTLARDIETSTIVATIQFPLRIQTAMDLVKTHSDGKLLDDLHISSFPVKWCSTRSGEVFADGRECLRMRAKPDKTVQDSKRRKTQTLEEMLGELAADGVTDLPESPSGGGGDDASPGEQAGADGESDDMPVDPEVAASEETAEESVLKPGGERTDVVEHEPDPSTPGQRHILDSADASFVKSVLARVEASCSSGRQQLDIAKSKGATRSSDKYRVERTTISLINCHTDGEHSCQFVRWEDTEAMTAKAIRLDKKKQIVFNVPTIASRERQHRSQGRAADAMVGP